MIFQARNDVEPDYGGRGWRVIFELIIHEPKVRSQRRARRLVLGNFTRLAPAAQLVHQLGILICDS